MALIIAVVCLGGQRVSKCKEVGVVSTLLAQRKLALQELIVQHGLDSLTSHVPATCALKMILASKFILCIQAATKLAHMSV